MKKMIFLVVILFCVLSVLVFVDGLNDGYCLG